MNIDIKRTVLNIATVCNLKCKHCLAFIPYYTERKLLSVEEARKTLKAFFEVVDSIEHFTVTGGEPLLNPDCYEIIKAVFEYENQIRNSVDFVTNGTIEIPENMLALFKEKNMRVILSDYGDLSTKISQIREKLDNYEIAYRISKFHGDNLYYDGWIDFTDHSLKWKTIEERNNNASKCLHNCGKYYVICDGELHRCSRSYWRMKNGIIPKIAGEYVPLIDENYSLDEKRNLLMQLYQSTSGLSCAHCVGLRNDVKRVTPAQQL